MTSRTSGFVKQVSQGEQFLPLLQAVVALGGSVWKMTTETGGDIAIEEHGDTWTRETGVTWTSDHGDTCQ